MAVVTNAITTNVVKGVGDVKKSVRAADELP
jgi:hypothetical protein